MAVSLSIEGDRELPADVTMTLYRIAQEALNNVIKHAEATRVDIMLLNEPIAWRCTSGMMVAALIPRPFPPDIWGSASWRSAPKRSALTCRFKANPVVALRSA